MLTQWLLESMKLGGWTLPLVIAIMLIGGLIVGLLVMLVVRQLVLRTVVVATRKTKTNWDDALVEARFFWALSWFAPLIIMRIALMDIASATGLDAAADATQAAAEGGEAASADGGLPSSSLAVLVSALTNILYALMAVAVLRVITRFLDAIHLIYGKTEHGKARPIKGYLQLIKIFAYVMTAIIAIAFLIGQSPWILVSGLGAVTAVLLLIFKDTILSLVASVQITSQRLIQVGDWLEVPQFGADGDVIDVALHTITVQNWDKTLSIIPTSRLIEGSFKNWRGMKEAGGRRIKRAIHLDVATVHFCDNAELERFKKMHVLRPYLDERLAEIERWNQEHEVDLDDVVNARRLTNLGCFREYLVRYLKKHERIHADGSMTFLVRHLQPGEHGLPIEIYVFTKTTVWAEYEGIQADIFDHVLAVLPEFGLRAFQSPSGSDVRELAPALTR